NAAPLGVERQKSGALGLQEAVGEREPVADALRLHPLGASTPIRSKRRPIDWETARVESPSPNAESADAARSARGAHLSVQRWMTPRLDSLLRSAVSRSAIVHSRCQRQSSSSEPKIWPSMKSSRLLATRASSTMKSSSTAGFKQTFRATSASAQS